MIAHFLDASAVALLVIVHAFTDQRRADLHYWRGRQDAAGC